MAAPAAAVGPGQIAFACGHVVTVGYGLARSSEEPCRACLEAEGAIGKTDIVARHRGTRAFLETLPELDDDGQPRRRSRSMQRRIPRRDATETLRGVLMRAIRNAVLALEAGLARVEKKLAGREELVRERDTIKSLLASMKPLLPKDGPPVVRRGGRKPNKGT